MATGSSLAGELSDIRQKVREIESGRSRRPVSAVEDPQRTITAQRSQIDKLKRENKQLQEELANDTKDTVASRSQQERIDKLNDLVDTYVRKLEIEGRQLESIQRELDVTQAKVHEMRKGANSSDGQKQAAKAMVVLENRLQQAEQRFGETIGRNRELRNEIESLNKQRETFDHGQIKLEKELQAKRAEIAVLQGTAMLANEARLAAVSQLETLRTQADKEQTLFDAESQELERCLARDQALLQAQAQRLERMLGAPDDDEAVQEDGGPSFSDTIDQLAEAAGIDPSNISALVSHYSGLEAANFATFNDCNAANEKITAMQKQIRAIQTESRQVEVEGVLGRQKEVIRQTLTKRDAALRRAEILDEKRVTMERRLSAVSAGVHHVLKSLDCPVVNPSDVHGTPTGTSPVPPSPYAALMGALGQLEARSRAVVAVWSMVMGKAGSVPGAQAMVNSQISSSISREAGVVAAAAAAAAVKSSSTDKPPESASAQHPATSREVKATGDISLSEEPKGSDQNQTLPVDDESEDGSSEDEAPLTREQMQSMRMAGASGTS